ncbi:MAG: hypothetical protein K0R93_2380 [Anaerosolibacter sp.]|jgi:hypothetical protein|nr:hypothetical protein [Anaerosolibacter sp.]
MLHFIKTKKRDKKGRNGNEKKDCMDINRCFGVNYDR